MCVSCYGASTFQTETKQPSTTKTISGVTELERMDFSSTIVPYNLNTILYRYNFIVILQKCNNLNL